MTANIEKIEKAIVEHIIKKSCKYYDCCEQSEKSIKNCIMNCLKYQEEYKNKIVKNGSDIFYDKDGIQIYGVRNSRNKRWSLNMSIDCNCADESCNYEIIEIAKGEF